MVKECRLLMSLAAASNMAPPQVREERAAMTAPGPADRDPLVSADRDDPFHPSTPNGRPRQRAGDPTGRA